MRLDVIVGCNNVQIGSGVGWIVVRLDVDVVYFVFIMLDFVRKFNCVMEFLSNCITFVTLCTNQIPIKPFLKYFHK